MREYLICVGGTWREGRAGTMPAVSPASGAAFASVAVAGPADVDDAVAAAGAAWPSWAALPVFERAACCRAVAAAIDARGEDLARTLTEDQPPAPRFCAPPARPSALLACVPPARRPAREANEH